MKRRKKKTWKRKMMINCVADHEENEIDAQVMTSHLLDERAENLNAKEDLQK